jgi:hypothetical protein
MRTPRQRAGPASSLLVLNLSLQGMAWLSAVFVAADQTGELSVGATGLLLTLALVWDLVTSGAEITNPDPPGFPRTARVLAYSGYLVLVAAYVVLASTLVLHGQGEFFKRGTEVLVIFGLIYLGVPRIVTTALLQLRRA